MSELNNIKFEIKSGITFKEYTHIVNSVSESVAKQIDTDNYSTQEIITVIALITTCTDIDNDNLSEEEQWKLYTNSSLIKEIIDAIGQQVYEMLLKDIERTVRYKMSFSKELKQLAVSVKDYLTSTDDNNALNEKNILELKELMQQLETLTSTDNG